MPRARRRRGWRSASARSFAADASHDTSDIALGDDGALQPADEPLGALGHDVPLLVERDHVIAVLQDERVDEPAQMRLEVVCVLEARYVVVARVNDERRLAHVAEPAALHRLHQHVEVGKAACRRAEGAGEARVAALHAGDDQSPHTLVLETVGLVLGQVELEPDRQRAQVAEWPRVPGHRPAVEPERRRQQQQAVHGLGTVLGQMDRQDAAHRKAAGNDDVALLLEQIVRGLDTGVPLPPGGAAQLLRRAAVASELAAVDRVAGTRQTLGDEPQLDRRPAEPMNEEDSHAPATDEQAAIRNLLVEVLPLCRRGVDLFLIFVPVSHLVLIDTRRCAPPMPAATARALDPPPRATPWAPSLILSGSGERKPSAI